MHLEIQRVNAQIAAEQDQLIFGVRMNPRGRAVNHQGTLVEDFDQASAHLTHKTILNRSEITFMSHCGYELTFTLGIGGKPLNC